MTQLLLNGIIAGSIYALIALGFTVIYQTVRFFNLAHGAVYAVGAYLAYSLIISLGMHPVVGFFLPHSGQVWSVSLLTGSSTALYAHAALRR